MPDMTEITFTEPNDPPRRTHFINLTGDRDGQPIWVNSYYIQTFFAKDGVTTIKMMDCLYFVKETPGKILERLVGTTSEKDPGPILGDANLPFITRVSF